MASRLLQNQGVPERLIFVRHAESELGARGLVNGDPALASPLTERGRAQAEHLSDRLAPERIDVCVTTSFPRTRETADIALRGRDVPQEVEPRLDDPPLGIFESRSADDYLEWLGAHDWSIGPEGGGESQLESVSRYTAGFEALLARPENSILVVGHAFPIGVARTFAYERPPVVRPHYDCDITHAVPIEIEPPALAVGIERARRELAEIG